MAVVIRGIGTALPPRSVTQIDWCNHAKQLCCEIDRHDKMLKRLYAKTGINSRSSVLSAEPLPDAGFYSHLGTVPDGGPTTAQRMQRYNQEVGKLAIAASQDAMQKACISSSNVTHLVTASCTGFGAPGFDLELVNRLGLSPSVYRTHIGFMGCHGAMNALRVGAAFCAANPKAVVMITAAELCSLHFQYGWYVDALVANSLFADGSASIILTSDGGGVEYVDSMSFVVPDTTEAMTWHVGNHGFNMTLSPAVPQLIEEYLSDLLEDWLAKHDLSAARIGGWAVHPGGPKILDAVQNCLGLDKQMLSPSRQVLFDYGNMSSPTVLFILQNIMQSKTKPPFMLLSFGPGLTIEAALVMAVKSA